MSRLLENTSQLYVERDQFQNGHQNDSADRAHCVREEPRIDAVQMEGMAAFGKQAEQLVVLELVETDHALECFFSLHLEALHEIVAEHREALNR